MPFLDELAAKLQADGVGTLGTTIFLSTKAQLPTGNGPFITIVETGGTTSRRTQNNTATQRPSAQVVARASSYSVARSKAVEAYLSLGGDVGLFNTQLSGVFYLQITANQQLVDIGLDDLSRARVAFNVNAEKAPS